MAQITGANLNDENLDAWGGEIVQLPPGQYQFRIKGADIEEKSGNDGETKLQMVVDSEVISGAMSGKVAKSWFSLDFSKDVTRKRLKSLVLATGIQVDGSGNIDTSQLVGCKYNADVIHDTYEGKADPITGQAVKKTAIRIVNERAFGAIASPDNKPAGSPAGVVVGGASALPGLTKA